MKNTPIRVLIVFGVITLAGIVFTQVYWVSKAIDNQEEQFSHSVQMALRNVVESLCQINGNDIPSNDPIDRISSNYFIARTNYRIDLQSLDYLIKGEFQKYAINQDFEYGVYDCQTNRMVYGDFVPMNSEDRQSPEGRLPKLDHEEYYFGVYFPSKKAGLVHQLGIWQFTTALTVVIIIFFGYALFVILKQKRLSEIQRDFINNVTHEFKTPLATLLVSAEVLKAESKSERQKKYAEIVLDESERLQQHVSQLLETSLLDSERQIKKREPVNPEELIKPILVRFREKEGLKVDFESRSSSPILVDRSLFENVIYNLVENAEKYGQGKVEVLILEEGNRVRIDVKDNGPGIPGKEQKKIFLKFYRIPQGDLHDVKGFGLGLYLVQQAMRQMNGKITLRSDASGSVFSLFFVKVS